MPLHPPRQVKPLPSPPLRETPLTGGDWLLERKLLLHRGDPERIAVHPDRQLLRWRRASVVYLSRRQDVVIFFHHGRQRKGEVGVSNPSRLTKENGRRSQHTKVPSHVSLSEKTLDKEIPAILAPRQGQMPQDIKHPGRDEEPPERSRWPRKYRTSCPVLVGMLSAAELKETPHGCLLHAPVDFAQSYI